MIYAINNLNSSDTTNALSANMGRVLNEAITSLTLRVVELENNLIDISNYVTKIWS